MNKVIYIKNGKQEKAYYYWEKYDTWEDAKTAGKKMKKNNTGLKYFIIKAQDSWFLPVNEYILYLNKKLRIL